MNVMTAPLPKKNEYAASLKFTAELIEQNCPRPLYDLGKRIGVHLEKARIYNDKAEQHYTAAGQLLAQVKDLCDEGGFDAVRNKFFPELGRTRIYEILGIAAGKKVDRAHQGRYARAR